MALQLKSSGGGSVTIADPASTASNFTLNPPLRSGTLAVEGPTFSAYKSSNQSVTNGAYAKITFDTKEFDTNTNYNNSTSVFTPTVAGYYLVTSQLAYAPGAALEQALMIFKNGSASKRLGDFITSDGRAIGGTALIYMNGSTDYLEIYFYTSVTMNVTAGAAMTYFQASMVRAA